MSIIFILLIIYFVSGGGAFLFILSACVLSAQTNRREAALIRLSDEPHF